MATINPARGMRDFQPADKAHREEILAEILRVYKSFGFQQIETPALEDIGRLSNGQGGDNEKLAFRVIKRGDELAQALENGSELADLGLRYDLTVPLTRFYATHHGNLPKVFKAIQTGPVWRAERPQKGRYRQFNQCDIDIIGDSSMDAEIELLIATLTALGALELQSATIRINHRELLTDAMLECSVPRDEIASALITIDKMDKIGIEGVGAEATEKFGAAIGNAITKWLASDVAIPEQLISIMESVAEHFPARLRFDKTLVRGMGYYTGAVFEIEHPGSLSSIGGGGRYDGMVGRLLGQQVAAVGMSIGFERVADLVVAGKTDNKSVVIIYSDLHQALRIQAEAIAAGYEARIEREVKNTKNLLTTLAENGFASFAVLSENDLSFSQLEIKSLD